MNFYLLLGLRPEATAGDIKRAYRRLARRYHPNINPGDQAAALRFRRIVEAYETLVDPERRRQYDSGDLKTETPPLTTFEFEGFDFSVLAEGAMASTFGDLFADVIRSSVSGNGASSQRGADLHGDVELTFDEAMRGVSRRVTVMRQARCGICRGVGRVETIESTCAQCGGEGSVRVARGHMLFTKPCVPCEGTGSQFDTLCAACRGEGIVMHSESVQVDVPPGAADGERLRLAEYGNVGRRNGPAGDLYITVRVKPHAFFRRQGDDVWIEVPITLDEAALGARIEVPAPGIIEGEGSCKLRVPPGTQSGQQFRVRERGAPSRRGGPPGDLIVTTRLVLPAIADERSKELIRELARLNPQDVRRSLGV
jgi:molecular chaperone DnaJ